MDRLAKNFLVVIGLVLAPTVAFAQGSIVGTVRDASGACCPASPSKRPARR